MLISVIFILLGAIIGVILLLPPKKNSVTEEFFAMDTVMDLTVYESDSSSIDPKEMIRKMQEKIYDLDAKLSVTNEKSEIYKLNHAGGQPVEISTEVYDILRTATRIAEETKGAFDPTLYPIVRLWGFTTQKYRVPSEEERKKELAKTGYERIQFLDNNQVKLDEGMEIDLGACAKGYLSDKLCKMMQQNRYEGIVSLGGNVQSTGHKEDGSPFVVGILDPSNGTSIYEKIESNETAVITSGNYERFFEENGKRYHHIMNHTTGAPAENNLASVTVTGPDGMYCDAYATALYVMGSEKAKEFIQNKPEYNILLIYQDGSSYNSARES